MRKLSFSDFCWADGMDAIPTIDTSPLSIASERLFIGLKPAVSISRQWVLTYCLLITIILTAGIAFAQDETTPDIHLLGINDADFPQVEVYASVADPLRHVPVKSLTFTNFSAVASNGQSLRVIEVQEERRPLRVVAVVDLTSSVSEEELFYQKLAVTKLAEGLGEEDEIALVTLGPRSALVASPLQSDHDPLLTALEDLETNPDLGGNVYWDALYGAVVMHDENSADVRQVVVLITDVLTDNADGEHNEEDTIALAKEKGVEIFALYFAYEGEEVPEDGPEIPVEVMSITEATGGAAFATAAQYDGESYTDEQALPVMAESVNQLVEHEYRLGLSALFPPDGVTYVLSISILVQGSLPGTPSSLPFVAGAVPATLPPGNDAATEPVSDNGATTEPGETIASIPSLSWVEVPPNTTAPDQVLTLQASIDLAGGIQYVSLLVNNVEVQRQETPPFEQVTFNWTPDQEGEYSLSIVAGSEAGVTVNPLIATIRVQPAGANMLIILAGSIAVGMVLAVGVIRWGLRRRNPVAMNEVTDSETQEATRMALRANAALETQDGYRWLLMPGENTIGRHGSNTIQIMDDSISRHHAIIEVVGMLCYYIDREASHPTEINGVLLTPDARHELRFGDTIRVGSTILKFVKAKD